MKLVSQIAGIAAVASSLIGGEYNVDVAHSNVGFKVKHLMISNVKGKFDKFDGNFVYDEKTNALLALNGVIQASSINTGVDDRDAHLKSKDFFEVETYPQITFSLSKVEGDKAYGLLDIHGVKKEIELEYEGIGSAKDPWGHQRAGFALTGEINRKDFGLTWNKALEAGGVLVGEAIKLDVEIEGISK